MNILYIIKDKLGGGIGKESNDMNDNNTNAWRAMLTEESRTKKSRTNQSELVIVIKDLCGTKHRSNIRYNQ